MTAPIVTPETTLRELGEILKRSELCLTWSDTVADLSFVDVYNHRVHETHEGEGADLAAAINDALTKAGAR